MMDCQMRRTRQYSPGSSATAPVFPHPFLLIKKGVSLKEIPEEQFRLLDNGDGEIFVEIRGEIISMRIGKNEFSFKH